MTALAASGVDARADAHPPRHAPALRALHWTIALLIFAAIGVGVYAIELPRSPFRLELLNLHKSLGLAVLALVVVRVVVRLVTEAPPHSPALDVVTDYASKLAHFALYALMIAMPVSGYIHSSASLHPFDWFGLFPVPMLVGEDAGLDHFAKQAHYVLAWAISAVIALHVLAALWHLLVKKDNVFARMGPRARRA
jgi:cytochrome b561